MKRTYIYILLFWVLDLISKQLVIHYFKLYESLKIIPNFFNLTYVRNSGAAFSIFQDSQSLILLVTVIALFYIYKSLNNASLKKLDSFAYSMITGGILGNLFDRLVYGYVIDFLDFRFGSYNYPVFNLADCFIVVGVIILGICMLLERRNEHGNKVSRRGRKNW